MSHKFGFPAMTDRALNNKAPNSSSSNEKDRFLVRVISIDTDESEGFTQIGIIKGEKISPTGILTGKIISPVYPSSTSLKKFPVLDEYVWVWRSLAPNSIGGQWVWEGPVSLYGIVSPNANTYPSPLSKNIPQSQQLNYNQVEIGAPNIVDNNFQNQPKPNLTNYTFIERNNIHPLFPFSGDTILEGRWGNSIRFGNTSKTTGKFLNTWSSTGNNGDPITILRNGQDPNSSDFGAEPIVENIKKDLSSIYLTSTQKLSNLGLANENFNSYKTKPILPSVFTSPQIALSSDRIVLNAKRDSVLISGQNSIGLLTNGSVNIDTPSLYISSNDIRLGSNNATQPVLLGDDTVNVLIELTSAIKDLATILQVQRDYPEGKLVTSYNAIAGNAIICLDSIIKTLNDNSLKSQTTKIQ